MKKETIKLTESRLRKLVEACVKEALEDAIEEGFGWDAMRDLADDDRVPSWDETKEFIKGEPDSLRHARSKDLYDAACDGMIYGGKLDSGNRSELNPYEHAKDAVISEPGFKGKARRAAIAGGVAAHAAGKKIGKAVKKGVNNVKEKFGKKNNEGGNYQSFTL